MARRGWILSGLVLLFMAAPAWSAAKADLSGTWLLDKSKSTSPPAAQIRPRAAGRAKLDTSTIDQRLVITQTPDEVNVQRGFAAKGKKRAGQQQTFRLDGTETTSAAIGGRGQLKGKASWQEDTLVVRGTQQVNSKRGAVVTNIEERWSLSEDGRILTVATTRSTARGRSATTKLVYNRQ